MRYGNESENLARRQYLQDSQKIMPGYNVVTTGLWVSAEHPELACSPDELVLNPNLKDHELQHNGLLEIKCPKLLEDIDVHDFLCKLSKKQLSNFCLAKTDGQIYLKKEHPYFYQIQMQLACTGLKWCDFVLWSSKSYFVERVLFDSKFWMEIKTKLLRFHHNELCPEIFEMKTPRYLSHIIFDNS